MRQSWLALPCLGALACTPELDDQPYLVDRARLITVVAEPAEARPGEAVTFSPVVAGPGSPELGFRFCSQARSLADPRPAAEACFDAPGVTLERQGLHGARGTVPVDACARFGPDPIGSNLRPADADATGGFYQPVVVDGLAEPSVLLLRIHCPLPDAPAELSRDLEERYQLNQNPRLAALEGDASGEFTGDFSVQAGVPALLRVTWPESAPEAYVWLPPDGSTVEPRQESLRVSWFVSSGTLASSATGGREGELALFSSNTFTPDPTASRVDLWAVLQDSRGGSTAKRWRLQVER